MTTPAIRPRAGWAARILAAVGILIVLAGATIAGVSAYGASREFDVTSTVELPMAQRIELELGTVSTLSVERDNEIKRPTLEVYGTGIDGQGPFEVDTSAEGTLRITSTEQEPMPWRSDGYAMATGVLLLPSDMAAGLEITASLSDDANLWLNTDAERVSVTVTGPGWADVRGDIETLELSGPTATFSARGEIGSLTASGASVDVNFDGVAPERADLDTNLLTVAGLPESTPLALTAPDWLVERFGQVGYTIDAEAPNAIVVPERLPEESFAWGDEYW